MAWLIGDGFDFYAANIGNELPGSIWTNANAGVQGGSLTRFGVGQAADPFANIGDYLQSVAYANSAVVWVNFAMRSRSGNYPTFGNTNQACGFALRDSTNTQVGIYFRVQGDIVATSDGGHGANEAVIATSSVLPTLVQQVWNHFQFKIVIHPSAGSVECRINGNSGTPDWTATGLNTRNGSSNTYCNNILIGEPASTELYPAEMDDFYMFNSLGGYPNDWQGDIRALQVMPNADISTTWTPLSGGSNFAMVNEFIPDLDTTYVFTNTPGNADLYSVTALPYVPKSIVCVQPKAYLRMDDSGPHQTKIQVKSAATTVFTPIVNTSSTWQWTINPYPLDPNTSTNWTPPNVNALQIGPVDVL